MEASVRVLNPTALNRRLSLSILRRGLALSPLGIPSYASNSSFSPPSIRPRHDRGRLFVEGRSIALLSRSASPSRSSFPFSNSNPRHFLLSLCNPQIPHFGSRDESFNNVASNEVKNEGSLGSVGGFHGGDHISNKDGGAVWMVVILGWLGAEEKHLKRYAELYHSRGIRSVAFCIPVKDLLWFDLGRKVEERIAGFAGEIASWLSETEKDGRERQLLFHTFSNTGWLVYGAILENLQTRSELIRKIQGCVIDSGADPEINPQVWAAGFCAALLRKRSSLTYSAVEPIKDNSVVGDKNNLQMQDNAFPWAETMLLVVLEKFFSLILRLPDIHRRLSKILCILSKKSPLCPQLYLYSSADKVIPACSVELFIEQQRSMGRKVWAHNFCSSPHVDHFRSFPQIYSSKVHEFLDECTSLVSNNPKTLIS